MSRLQDGLSVTEVARSVLPRPLRKQFSSLVQTLISTARSALGEDEIDRDWLRAPGNSIRAGAAYIARQWKETHLDPPKVACAYNAGGLYYNDAPDNR